MSKKNDLSSLEKEIERLLADMSKTDSDSKEYSEMSQRLDTLYKLKEVDAKVKNTEFLGVKSETLALIVANLSGILMIVGHEQARTITSKGMGFVKKLF